MSVTRGLAVFWEGDKILSSSAELFLHFSFASLLEDVIKSFFYFLAFSMLPGLKLCKFFVVK